MSLINKMLQDLDARQSGAREASHLYTKPVAYGERQPSPLLIGVAVAATLAVAVGGVLGWRFLHRAPAPSHVPAPAKVVIVPAAPLIKALPPQPAAVAAPGTPSVEAPSESPVVEASTKPAAEERSPAAPAKQAKHGATARHVEKHDKHDKGQHAGREHRDKELHAAKAKRVEAAAAQAPAAQGKEESANQKAEAAYRRGLASMQEGYVSEAASELERAVQLNPHHDAARQTLVGLLIDNRRPDEAMRQLQLALTLDPKQPSMAMLLARLQIERGGSGIDTLMRTLPYVGANGEYHAFLAGALERQQRHREAIEQYQAALRSLPQNGVWLMGLGISLQAEKREAEALDVFRKAKGSGTLNPQLAGFVDGKILQLSR